MLHAFWNLAWVETKIFLREPMGVVGTLLLPVVIFLFLGGSMSSAAGVGAEPPFNVPILAALLLAISAATSLVAIISIYREGGILKRLRATPLSPVTILGVQVFIKLGFTLVGLGLLILAGRRLVPGPIEVDLLAFAAALLLGTLSILSLGFVIASLVPTARFAQPLSAALLYPMIAVSGLFLPVDSLPPALRAMALALPTTHAVSLMQSVWDGSGWRLTSTAALLLIFLTCTALAAKVFRWE